MHSSPEKLWTRDYIFLALSIFLLTTAFYLLLPTLPIYVMDLLEVGNSGLGLIIAVFTLAALLIRPFAGLGVDLYGRKWILIGSTVLFSVLFLGYNWAVLFVPLLVLRFLHGLQWGTATSAYFAAAVDIIPVKKRGRGIGYFGLAFNLAMAIGPAIGLLVMGDDRYDWLFYTALLISLLGLMFLALFKFPPFTKPDKKKLSFKDLYAKKSIPVSFNVLLVVSAFGGIVTFLPIYAIEIGMQAYTAWYFTLLAVGMGLARLFSGPMFDRFGPRNITAVGIILAIAGLWLISARPGCGCFLISAVVMGLGLGIVVPILQTMANNVVPKQRRGVANSTFLTGLDLGIGLGSLYTGWLADLFSLSVAFQIISGILLLGFILFFAKSLPHYHANLVNE